MTLLCSFCATRSQSGFDVGRGVATVRPVSSDSDMWSVAPPGVHSSDAFRSDGSVWSDGARLLLYANTSSCVWSVARSAYLQPTRENEGTTTAWPFAALII